MTRVSSTLNNACLEAVYTSTVSMKTLTNKTIHTLDFASPKLFPSLSVTCIPLRTSSNRIRGILTRFAATMAANGTNRPIKGGRRQGNSHVTYYYSNVKDRWTYILHNFIQDQGSCSGGSGCSQSTLDKLSETIENFIYSEKKNKRANYSVGMNLSPLLLVKLMVAMQA